MAQRLPRTRKHLQSECIHSGKLTVKFSSGHGINGAQQSQTIPYNGSMNFTSWDANPGCDPIFGVPTDVKCYAVSSGGEIYNQSGANLGGPGNMPEASRTGTWTETGSITVTKTLPLTPRRINAGTSSCTYRFHPTVLRELLPATFPIRLARAYETYEKW